MSLNKILTSIHGQRLGLSASGGILHRPTTSTGVSHAAEISSAGVFNSSVSSFNSTIGQMTVQDFKTVSETVSSSGDTMTNYGLSIVGSASATAALYTLPAPDGAGDIKIIYVDTSGSAVNIDGTAASAFGASVDSSRLTVVQGPPSKGTSVVLLGLSGSRWGLLARSVHGAGVTT